MPPQPIRALFKELGASLVAFARGRLLKLPVNVAQSVKWMRLITLAGFSILSTILITVTMHVAKVQEAVRATEEHARDTSRNINLLMGRMIGISGIAQKMLQQDKSLRSDLRAGKPVLPLAALLQPPESPGLAVLINGETFRLVGDLDPTSDNRNWSTARWNEISVRIARELTGKSEVTLFLSLERVFRTEEDFNKGNQLGGSIVIARAWTDATEGWIAVVLLVPLRTCFPFMHLGIEDYHSGNYDYLVDSDGYMLAHPRYQLIKGTDSQGRPLRAASNDAEVGHLPFNTRDSDWVAGSDIVSKAFSTMIRGTASSIVYKNLTGQYRLTSFHIVDAQELGVDGYRLGVISGRGLSSLQRLTAPFLLRSPTNLNAVLQVFSSIFVVLLGGWLWLVAKFSALHQDLLDLERYVSHANADRLGLLPIKAEPAPPHVFSDMVGIVLSLHLTNLHVSNLSDLLDVLGSLSEKLRDDGWIVSPWTLKSLIASRHLHSGLARGIPQVTWSPSEVAHYFQTIKEQVPNGRLADLNVTYGVGDLRLHAVRKGRIRRAVVALSGSCVDAALQTDLLLSKKLESSTGTLTAAEKDLIGAGLPLLGERFVENGLPFRQIAFIEALHPYNLLANRVGQ